MADKRAELLHLLEEQDSEGLPAVTLRLQFEKCTQRIVNHLARQLLVSCTRLPYFVTAGTTPLDSLREVLIEI